MDILGDASYGYSAASGERIVSGMGGDPRCYSTSDFLEGGKRGRWCGHSLAVVLEDDFLVRRNTGSGTNGRGLGCTWRGNKLQNTSTGRRIIP